MRRTRGCVAVIGQVEGLGKVNHVDDFVQIALDESVLTFSPCASIAVHGLRQAQHVFGLDGADGGVAGLFGRKVVPRAAERRRCASP